MKYSKYIMLAVCAAAAGTCLVLTTQVYSETGNSKVVKLEGAWIGQADNGVRAIVTYSPSDPSSRRATFHNQMVWPAEVLALAGCDAVTDEIAEEIVTGPNTGSYSGIWYGLINGQIVSIFLDSADITYLSPTEKYISHTVEAYLASTDADNDGYPDPDSLPAAVFSATTLSKRVAR
jgi:hypothetical protein